jgi:hypothetical protein
MFRIIFGGLGRHLGVRNIHKIRQREWSAKLNVMTITRNIRDLLPCPVEGTGIM